MKKILVCFIIVFCFVGLMGQSVFAANTYTQKEIIDGVGLYEAGSIIQFENEVEVIVKDLDRNEVFKQKGESVVLPDYSPKLGSFKGWIYAGVTSSDGKVKQMKFEPFFKTDIQVNKVTDGNPITLTVPKDQIPFGEGKYTTEWIVGGMAGGYAIKEAPKNSLTWTIPTNSENYKDGMKIALRITNNEGKHIFSEEAVLVIEDKVPVADPELPDSKDPVKDETLTVKPSQDKNIVKTDDLQPVLINVLAAISSIGLIVVLKKKKSNS